MSCYHHLTIEEREKLYAFQQMPDLFSIRKIASVLGRAPSTISRELKRNANCLPHQAQEQYYARRRRSVRKHILSDPELHKYVHFFLGSLYWSPEQISRRFKAEGKYSIGTSTIYRALENGMLQDALRYYLRLKYKTIGKAKRAVKACFSHTLEQRPEQARLRTEVGHWEGDTIVSHKSKAVIATLVDRKSRYLAAGIVKSKQAAEVRTVIVRLLQREKEVKTITFDQGVEFSEGEQIEQALNAKVFYAHPHSPWERPTNENTNGLLRQFIPKHTDIGMLSQDDVSRFVSLLNLRPRKCLNWSTPYEAFSHQVLHFT